MLLLLIGWLFKENINGQILNAFFPLFSYFLVIYTIKKKTANNSIEIQSILGTLNFKTAPWFKLLLITLLMLLFGYATVLTIVGVVFRMNPTFFYEFLLTPSTTENGPFIYKLLNFFVTIFLAPVAEELYFRGYLINRLGTKRNLVSAVMISSLLFSLLHIESFFLPQFFSGMIYGLLYIKTQKLVFPMIIHSFHNFLAGLPLLLPETEVQISQLPSLQTIENVFQIGSILFVIMLPIMSWLLYRELKKIESCPPYYLNEQLFSTR